MGGGTCNILKLKDVSTISILWVNTTSSCYFSSGVYL